MRRALESILSCMFNFNDHSPLHHSRSLLPGSFGFVVLCNSHVFSVGRIHKLCLWYARSTSFVFSHSAEPDAGIIPELALSETMRNVPKCSTFITAERRAPGACTYYNEHHTAFFRSFWRPCLCSHSVKCLARVRL